MTIKILSPYLSASACAIAFSAAAFAVGNNMGYNEGFEAGDQQQRKCQEALTDVRELQGRVRDAFSAGYQEFKASKSAREFYIPSNDEILLGDLIDRTIENVGKPACAGLDLYGGELRILGLDNF